MEPQETPATEGADQVVSALQHGSVYGLEVVQRWSMQVNDRLHPDGCPPFFSTAGVAEESIALPVFFAWAIVFKSLTPTPSAAIDFTGVVPSSAVKSLASDPIFFEDPGILVAFARAVTAIYRNAESNRRVKVIHRRTAGRADGCTNSSSKESFTRNMEGTASHQQCHRHILHCNT